MAELWPLLGNGDGGNVWVTAPGSQQTRIAHRTRLPIHLPALPTMAGIHKKKSESGGKGMQDKYCVSILPPLPFQLSLTLTDEQWKCFELCRALSSTSVLRTGLSKPDGLRRKLIDLLSVRRVFPLFFQERLGFSPVLQTRRSCVVLAPLINIQNHEISTRLSLIIERCYKSQTGSRLFYISIDEAPTRL